LGQTEHIETPERLYAELWVSLASLLRSYTAAHGLSSNQETLIEQDEVRIWVAVGNRWLDLRRHDCKVLWFQVDGKSGVLELTEAGLLRNETREVEMDKAAEEWARELMR
jgi:hypothetical protein